MAERPAWTIKNEKITYKTFFFEWNSGFAVSQKQKNIVNLHKAIGQPTLEISTKSLNDEGKQLSAFNLKLDGITLENVFQSAKVYQNGGAYYDLLTVSPKDAKSDERHKTSGALQGFMYQGKVLPLLPKTAFYDYIYCKAVLQSRIDLSILDKFEFFTDIEFNPNKSINCQARAVAILKLILQTNSTEVLGCFDSWIEYHKNRVL